MKDHEFYQRLSTSNEDQFQQQQQQQQRVLRTPYIRSLNVDNVPAQFRVSNYLNNNANDVARLNNAVRLQQQQQEVNQDYSILPFIIVSTSSIIQIANTCKNITSLNLSYTSLLHDSLIAETGEYVSTLQHYAVQPGLTHIQIPIKQAIQAIGKECLQLQEVKIQRCEWVTAHVIWMFVYYCSNLKKLDARRSTKCTVKRLISTILEDPLSYLNSHTSYPITTTATTAAALLESESSNSSNSSSNSTAGGGDSSIVVPSSSSSSTVDANNDFTALFNDTNAHMNSNNNTIVFNEEEEEEEHDEMTNDNDNITYHFRFNGEFIHT